MEQQSLIRGYMKLKRCLTEREQQIMGQTLKYIIDIDDWWMAEGSYQCDQFWRIFQVCSEITAKKIIENYRKEVLNDLLPINFPFLIQLNLSMNNIESIEGISRLNAPCLKYLYISSNNISEMKSLRKAYFPNLKTLNIYENKIVDLSWSSALLCSQNMNGFYIEYDDNEHPIILQNFSILFKLKAMQIQNITWSHITTIRNTKQINMLANKYPGIKLDNVCIKN